MPEKKGQNRFTIQFNPGDPAHQQVIELLNQQGRKKAQFIVNTVQHYLHCSETPDIPQAAPIDTNAIEIIVRRILDEQDKSKSEPPAAKEKTTDKESKPSEHINFDETAEALGADGLAAIANTMAMFRKG